MCTDTIPVLAYVKIELFFADICYYQRLNPKPITDMAKKIAEQLIDTLAESGVERIYAVTGDSPVSYTHLPPFFPTSDEWRQCLPY